MEHESEADSGHQLDQASFLVTAFAYSVSVLIHPSLTATRILAFSDEVSFLEVAVDASRRGFPLKISAILAASLALAADIELVLDARLKVESQREEPLGLHWLTLAPI